MNHNVAEAFLEQQNNPAVQGSGQGNGSLDGTVSTETVASAKKTITPGSWRMLAALITATNMIMLSGCSFTDFVATWGRSDKTASITDEAVPGVEVKNVSTSSTGTNNQVVGELPLNAALKVTAGEKVVSGETLAGAKLDESAAWVMGQGELTVRDCTVEGSGETSSEEGSRLYGRNAVLLSNGGGMLKVEGGSVSSKGMGAAGVFASGSNASASVSRTNISTVGDSSSGVRASAGGSLTALNCNVTTTGADSPGASVGKGGGTLTVNGGSYTVGGLDSPGVLARGETNLLNASVNSQFEAARVEGDSLLTSTGASLETAGDYCVKLVPPTAEGSVGIPRFEMNGGSLKGGKQALIGVGSTKGEVVIQNGTLPADTLTLIKVYTEPLLNQPASASLTANGQTLYGDIVCEEGSSLTVDLTNASTFNGGINKDSQKGLVSVTIDASSVWNVSADSYIGGLTASLPTLNSIKDDGHTIYYQPNHPDNQWLGGQTMDLPGGGKLTPGEDWLPAKGTSATTVPAAKAADNGGRAAAAGGQDKVGAAEAFSGGLQGETSKLGPGETAPANRGGSPLAGKKIGETTTEGRSLAPGIQPENGTAVVTEGGTLPPPVTEGSSGAGVSETSVSVVTTITDVYLDPELSQKIL